jgi:predicted dehydrogenase
MGSVRIGVVGMGPRGIWFGVESFLKSDPRAEIVAMCDRDPRQLEYAVQQTGVRCAQYQDLNEMLSDPNIDAVINCTDDPDHAETSIPILEAGKALYLEKPMAQTIEDCDRMIEVWRRNPSVFIVGLELRYCTLFQEVRRIIDRGEIGDIKIGTVVDNVSVGGNYYFHGRDRRDKYVKTLILEKGTHSLDLSNWFVGSHPSSVYASSGLSVFGGTEPNTKRCRSCPDARTCPYYVQADSFVLDYGAVVREKEDFCVWAEEIDVDDNSIVTIDYENGARISYVECHFTPEYTREFMFVGDKGKLTAHYDNEQNFSIEVHRRHSTEVDRYYPPRVEGEHGGGDPLIIKRFLDLVEAGEPCAVGVEGARDSAAIAIAAFDSKRSRSRVDLPRVADIEKLER